MYLCTGVNECIIIDPSHMFLTAHISTSISIYIAQFVCLFLLLVHWCDELDSLAIFLRLAGCRDPWFASVLSCFIAFLAKQLKRR